MNADSTGRPTMTLAIHAPGREVLFTGNIWEILIEMRNATYHGFASDIVGRKGEK